MQVEVKLVQKKKKNQKIITPVLLKVIYRNNLAEDTTIGSEKNSFEQPIQ